MRRLLWAALVAAALPASSSAASLPAALIEDATTFRAALPAVAANLELQDGGPAQFLRFERGERPPSLTDAAGAALPPPADGDAAFARALLLAALSSTSPVEALAGLGCDLDRSDLGLFLFAHPAESVIVRRIGTDNRCWLGLEPEIARPREWAITRNRELWVARIGAYSGATNGWFPERIDIVRNGQNMLSLLVTSVAPAPRDLPPLPAAAPPAIASPTPALPTSTQRPSSPRRLPL